jgi:hypothetical protein
MHIEETERVVVPQVSLDGGREDFERRVVFSNIPDFHGQYQRFSRRVGVHGSQIEVCLSKPGKQCMHYLLSPLRSSVRPLFIVVNKRYINIFETSHLPSLKL